MKVENKATVKVPGRTEETIQSVFETVPKEHLRGLTRVVLVDRIVPDSRVPIPSTQELPGLYHPRQGNIQPWCEIAVNSLLPNDGFFKRLAAKLNYRPNLAYLVLSLQAQHYYLNLSHGIKKHQYEGAIRTYVDQYHRIWREKQSGWRGKLFKPLQPYIDKWARSLRKKYQEDSKSKK